MASNDECPMGLTGYYVLKTTTEKLSEMLNGFTEGWEVTQVTHVGGRDWVVIAKIEFENEYHRDMHYR
jgi:hypothetical protein